MFRDNRVNDDPTAQALLRWTVDVRPFPIDQRDRHREAGTMWTLHDCLPC